MSAALSLLLAEDPRLPMLTGEVPMLIAEVVVLAMACLVIKGALDERRSAAAGRDGSQIKVVAQDGGAASGAPSWEPVPGEPASEDEFSPLRQFLKAALTDCGVSTVRCTRVGQVLEVAVVAVLFGRVVRGGRAYVLEREAARVFGKSLGIEFVSICSEPDGEFLL